MDSTIQNILGELLWHSVTVDPAIGPVSDAHYANIARVVEAHLPEFGQPGRRNSFLEIAAYAHTTGYRIASRYRADVTLTDISVETLSLGERCAAHEHLATSSVSRVACDFHELPFENDQFDVVYIASALHHTWRWQAVVREMLRVLAPGGLLYLQNEPVHRAFALYKFRSNRAESMRPFEKALADQGLLRTIADPIPGSRPEELFGMIENQTIPLSDLKTELTRGAQLVEFNARTADMIGDLEGQLLKVRNIPVPEIASFLNSELTRRLDLTRTSFSETDAALGCVLPSSQEVEALAWCTAAAAARLPADESSHAFGEGVAQLFGAAIEGVVRKNGALADQGARPLKFASGTRSGVVIGYPPAISAVIERTVDHLPDIQTSSEQDLSETFPEAEWISLITAEKLRVFMPKREKSTIHCSSVTSGRSITILVRIYLAHSGKDWRLRVSYGDAVLAETPVYQSDSAIISCSFVPLEGRPAIALERLEADSDGPASYANLTIVALRAFSGA